ncbi:MAG: hypothetical protein UT13_C0001G0102 [Candidatus Pacebacteria bacterium GW2011_GWF2_38_9]|nr:MAG: lubJA protein [candidate division TM6 bacterium GW2011_GWF2_28_16]KKQ88456.1 MAG: hypothetical protein UT13_C0001G0102 [Candidatus Pacebacteria bacterium GW2011_GWF2_38_9]HAZ73069.1 hypothetical protein [Candidatus Paceibacterota bacterium]
MKKVFFIFALFSLFIFSIYFFYRSYAFIFFVKDRQVIKLVLKENFFASKEKELLVEVVRTKQSTTEGLSNRKSLESVNGQKIDGLLFIFPEKTVRRFWMKEMLFNIDICWLNNLDFLSCQRSAQLPSPGEDLKIYSSNSDSNVVLETNPNRLSDDDLKLKLFFQW